MIRDILAWFCVAAIAVAVGLLSLNEHSWISMIALFVIYWSVDSIDHIICERSKCR